MLDDNPGVVITADRKVVGREDELVRLSEFVSALSERPSALVIRGEAGIGKTTLWHAGIEAAEAAGLTILSTRCVEAELPLGLVGLSDLLEHALNTAGNDLADHHHAALAVAAGLDAPRDVPADAIALPRAFLALLHTLAREMPVVMALDDVQWLDLPSRRIVSFAARRLRGAPVGILVTQRADSPDPLGLARAFDSGSFEEIRVGGLSIGAVAHLIRSRLDLRIPRPLLARVHAASGGNPMFALEFARLIAATDGPQFGPLPLPASLEELVRTRIAAYPSDVRRLLAIAAAVERPTPSLLRSAEPSAATLLDAAVDAGAVLVGEDGIVRFAHPLLASAAYADLASSERRAVHRGLAEVAADDLETRARHLALSSAEPDERVATVLDEAAAHAQARGAPDAAAEFAREAVRLTRLANVGGRQERTLSVAEYLFEAGRHDDARDWIDEFLGSGVTGPRRARALLLSLTVEPDDELMKSRLEEALEHVADDRRLRAHVLLGMSACLVDEAEASEKIAREAAAIAEEVGDRRLLATALGAVARRAALAGRAEPALAERALELAETNGTLRGWPTARMVLAVGSSLRQGDLSGARELLEAELAQILNEGREYDRARVLIALAYLEWRAGRWASVERHLEDLDELAAAGDETAEAVCLVAKGRLAGAHGDVDEARRLLAEAQRWGEARHAPMPEVGWALGALALALEQPARAEEELAAAAQVPDPRAFHLARLDAFADRVEACVAMGRVLHAEKLLRRLDEEARNRHLWATQAALRCQALLRLARGDPEAAEIAADAAHGFEAAGFPLDQGRALLIAGEALRRAGERRRAADKLEAARAIFTELGAALWVDRTETELRRARPRPRRDRELTAAERRVAALVADGRTNKEVAAQLFTTVATVESHLTRIYRKLGVRSRTELVRRVAEGTLSLADE
jgi:DNA-binding CsgD family transcriptional regulator